MSAGGGDASSSRLHLLEVTVISAQDLHHRRLGRRVRAYAVAWADYAEQRLRTEANVAGGPDPTWNGRFVFRVDAGFLRSETAAITVEVRAVRRLRMVGADAVLGRTRVVVSTFVRPSGPGMFSPSSGVVALQLRRPRSLRPQGILNVAVTLLDGATAAARTMTPGSPDAVAVKELVTMKQASLCEITEEEEEPPSPSPPLGNERRQPRVVEYEYSSSLDAKGAAVEQRKLEIMLEKWRADLSPERKDR